MRVKKDVVEDVRRLIAMLPPAVMTKCSVCNDTLTPPPDGVSLVGL